MKEVWKVETTFFAQFFEPMRVIPEIEIRVSEWNCRVAAWFFGWRGVHDCGGRSEEPSQIVAMIQAAHNKVGKTTKAADDFWIFQEFIENPELLACLAGVDVPKMIDP
ncbi:MAG: hypothetical protein L7W43_16675 [Rubripirellula sp.]|nr:hypothetical protein [Rubripirellula sp.]